MWFIGKHKHIQSEDRELRESIRRIETLQAIAEVSFSRLDLDNTLQELLSRVVKGIGTHFGILWLYDEETQKLVTKATMLAEQGQLTTAELDVDATIPALVEVLNSSHPLVFTREQFYSLGLTDNLQQWLNDKSIQSILITPLRIDTRLIGCICTASISTQEYAKEEIELLEIVADRSAIVIESSRLNEEAKQYSLDLERKNSQLEEAVNQLNILQDITEVGLSQLESDDLFHETLRQLDEH